MSDFNVIFQTAFLVGAAAWAINELRNLALPIIAYSLHFIYGLFYLSNIAFGIHELAEPADFAKKLTSTLAIPLIATQVCLMGGMQNLHAQMNLVIPLLELLCYLTGNPFNLDLLFLSKILSTFAIAWFVFQDERKNLFGYLLGAICFLTEFCLAYESSNPVIYPTFCALQDLFSDWYFIGRTSFRS